MPVDPPLDRPGGWRTGVRLRTSGSGSKVTLTGLTPEPVVDQRQHWGADPHQRAHDPCRGVVKRLRISELGHQHHCRAALPRLPPARLARPATDHECGAPAKRRRVLVAPRPTDVRGGLLPRHLIRATGQVAKVEVSGMDPCDSRSVSREDLATSRSRSDLGYDHAARITLSVALAALLCVGATAGSLAAPSIISAAEPMHVFGWPSSGAPNDPYFSYQTDLTPIGVAAAWTQTTGSADAVVAVLDTGLDATNPEFTGRIVPGYNALTGAEDGPTDFSATLDDNGHGTHVSGTIAAAADNAVGITGIAPKTAIMPIKVLDSQGKGDTLGIAKGLAWAIAHGARIVTLSLAETLPADSVCFTEAPFEAAYAAGVVAECGGCGDGRRRWAILSG